MNELEQLLNSANDQLRTLQETMKKIVKMSKRFTEMAEDTKRLQGGFKKCEDKLITEQTHYLIILLDIHWEQIEKDFSAHRFHNIIIEEATLTYWYDEAFKISVGENNALEIESFIKEYENYFVPVCEQIFCDISKFLRKKPEKLLKKQRELIQLYEKNRLDHVSD